MKLHTVIVLLLTLITLCLLINIDIPKIETAVDMTCKDQDGQPVPCGGVPRPPGVPPDPSYSPGTTGIPPPSWNCTPDGSSCGNSPNYTPPPTSTGGGGLGTGGDGGGETEEEDDKVTKTDINDEAKLKNFFEQQMIEGIPNWVLVGGGCASVCSCFALLLVLVVVVAR